MAYISDIMTWDSFDKFCPDEMLDQMCLVRRLRGAGKADLLHQVPPYCSGGQHSLRDRLVENETTDQVRTSGRTSTLSPWSSWRDQVLQSGFPGVYSRNWSFHSWRLESHFNTNKQTAAHLTLTFSTLTFITKGYKYRLKPAPLTIAGETIDSWV